MRGRSTLNTALKAVSLALLGNRPHSKPIRPRAVKEYSKALQEVNFALQNPELALEDNTLASVILLGMFEVGALCTWSNLGLGLGNSDSRRLSLALLLRHLVGFLMQKAQQ